MDFSHFIEAYYPRLLGSRHMYKSVNLLVEKLADSYAGWLEFYGLRISEEVFHP